MLLSHVIFIIGPANKITIREVNLKVSDIGRDWVYLTWNDSVGVLICNDETYLNSNEMNNKTSMNISFNIPKTGISYNCSIANDSIPDSMKLRNNHVNFTLGRKDNNIFSTNKHSC